MLAFHKNSDSDHVPDNTDTSAFGHGELSRGRWVKWRVLRLLSRRPVGLTLFGRLADLNDDQIGQSEDLLPTSFGRGAGTNILIKYFKNEKKKYSSSSIHYIYSFFVHQHIYYNLTTVNKIVSFHTLRFKLGFPASKSDSLPTVLFSTYITNEVKIVYISICGCQNLLN